MGDKNKIAGKNVAQLLSCDNIARVSWRVTRLFGAVAVATLSRAIR